MNREIRFRAQEVDTGKWVYGSLINTVGADKRPLIHVSPEEGEKIVDPATIGQFVRNGIYDGDILDVWNTDDCYTDEEGGEGVRYGYITRAFVKWGGDEYPAFDIVRYIRGTRGQLVSISIDDEHNAFSNCCWDWKVIGNMHDNPELLEAE